MEKEIKVGDKVRVSENVPKIYRQFISMGVFEALHSVLAIEDGMAFLGSIPPKYKAMFPTKYLVKVENWAFDLSKTVSGAGLHQDNYLNEDDKPKIKVGNYVRLKKGCATRKIYRRFEEWVSTVTKIENGKADIQHGKCTLTDVPLSQLEQVDALEYYHVITQSDLIKDFDPEEHRIRNAEAAMHEWMMEELDRVHNPEKYTNYEVEVNKSFINWTQYEVELAKEVAVKIVNKNMDSSPEDVGKYAVCLAKGIIEELKKK